MLSEKSRKCVAHVPAKIVFVSLGESYFGGFFFLSFSFFKNYSTYDVLQTWCDKDGKSYKMAPLYFPMADRNLRETMLSRSTYTIYLKSANSKGT